MLEMQILFLCEREEILLVDYLLNILVYVYMRKEENNLCGFSIIDTDFCVEIRISLCGRKEGG